MDLIQKTIPPEDKRFFKRMGTIKFLINKNIKVVDLSCKEIEKKVNLKG